MSEHSRERQRAATSNRKKGKKIEEEHTSLQIPLRSSHNILGSIFFKKARLTSVSTISSSASRGCRGKDAGFVLQVLMAQVRKLRVRSFIFALGVYISSGA